MVIRKVQINDFPVIAKLGTSFFKVHNIFQQDKTKVVAYLKQQAEENSVMFSTDW